MARNIQEFQSIRSEGGLLPPDLLRRVTDPRSALEGTRPEDYGLPPGDRLNESITQSWNRLRKYWADYRAAVGGISSEGEAATGLTNEKWTLPLLRELQFGTLPVSAGPEIGGRSYPIQRFSGPVPIHLVGCRVSLDRKSAGVRGAAGGNPHGLVQEFLNRSESHLWAIVSNGDRLRILRDNQALSRQSFLEFDLETMFLGELYGDFVLLWMVAHATRFQPREQERPETCWLERWTQIAEEEGTRALTNLRGGVEKALEILGQGFVGHPRNTHLRERLRSGVLTPVQLHAQLLRIIYRLILLFVAEDRELEGIPVIHPQDRSDEARRARDRYTRHYSLSRLREIASRIKGSRHADLWRQFQLTVGALSGAEAFAPMREQLALPVLGSFLWDPTSTPDLNGPGLADPGTELSNFDFLEALRHLAFTRQGKVLRPVDYKNLGSEEFGGVYESLLSLTPQIGSDGGSFAFVELAGNERKISGSYYTPDSLVQCLLDTALDPVVEERIKGLSGDAAEKALLSIKVCDPAVGSGHFLVGAAHRLARHLARIRSLALGEGEPSPLLYQHALRDVISHCLYGVDLNPMSAELCRVSLWLEALEPGKPLSFLDHRIRVGNSLLGTTPELVAKGIPDDAFKPIEGDEKEACSELKKRNKRERSGHGDLFASQDAQNLAALQQAAGVVDSLPDDAPDAYRQKEVAFRNAHKNAEYLKRKALFDTWCAAFVAKKVMIDGSPTGITKRDLQLVAQAGEIPEIISDEVIALSREYQFFHWPLEFSEVFGADGKGGFDVNLGNPPWERVKLQEKEWFSAHGCEDIAEAPNAAARKRMIARLEIDDPGIYKAFLQAIRVADGIGHLLANSGEYPLCGRGDINLYTVFAERLRRTLSPAGRMGAVLPSGIATDDTTKFFFQDLGDKRSIRSLYDFENRNGIFEGVHRSYKFCLLTTGSAVPPPSGYNPSPAQFAFFCHSVDDLKDPEKRFPLSAEEIELLNPNTRTCPIFRGRKDAEITKAIYRRIPVFEREVTPQNNNWKIQIRRVFDMNKQEVLSECITSLKENYQGTEWSKMMEAKLIHQFDHRFASYQGEKTFENERLIKTLDKSDLSPRYWVKSNLVKERLDRLWDRDWLLVWRDICRTTDERTVIASIINYGATDFTLRVGFPKFTPIMFRPLIAGNLNSFCFDYCARQLMGGTHLSDYIIRQLPVISPDYYKKVLFASGDFGKPLNEFLIGFILELSYTAWDLEPFAKDCGWDGPPFRWDEERRFLLRCELDAAFFHLYLPTTKEGSWKPAKISEGAVHDETPEQLAELTKHFPTPRDAVSYIMETFPIVKRKDEAQHGCYRTKQTILEIYDAMQTAIATGQPYQTKLNPPPADPSLCHPPRS
jgi:hypothetical protein